MSRQSRFDPWLDPVLARKVTDWSALLLDSYRRWTGRPLLAPDGDRVAQAKALFEAPFVVVSHGTEPDPILNYGNRTALTLWETDWLTLTAIASRQTAEPVNRAERERMLAEAATRGFIDNYRGIRITTMGRRFRVERALVWNVTDDAGTHHGQAATFAHWAFLD